MKLKLTKKQRGWLIGLIVAMEILLAVLVIGGAVSGALSEGAVGAIVTVLLLLVPVLLVALLLTVLYGGKKGERSDGESQERAVSSPPSGTAPLSDGESRFCMLTRLEEERRLDGRVPASRYRGDVTLASFCEDFRNYAASELKLYYSIDDIRRFVAGMAVSKILILQGMSGTGKTSLAHAFGEFVDNRSTVIPVQPMWKERTDLIGYYNEFTKRFNETILLEKMYEANGSEDMYVTVLDEMNIARVEYYFAEFLSLLELPNPEERYLTVVSDVWENDPAGLVDGRIKLPVNMWFIGTANNDDSTFAISDKVYDRAMVLDLDRKSEKFSAPKTRPVAIRAAHFEALAEAATREYAVSSRNRGRLKLLDEYLMEHFHITFGNRIMKQIDGYVPVFIACGGDELVALDDILAKKVLRKLETQNPIYLRASADGLLSYLDELFGEGRMTACRATVERIRRNA